MALSTFVGSFTVPAATGNKAVTGVGFQPKLVYFWGNGYTADGDEQGPASRPLASPWWGWGVSSSSRVAMTEGDDGVTANNTATDATKCIKRISGVTTIFAADFVSHDADGLTVNFTTANATAMVVNFIALGGSDLTNVGLITLTSATATGNQATTGMGFQPDVVWLMGADNSASNNSTTMGLGRSSTERVSWSQAANATTGGRIQKTSTAYTNLDGGSSVRCEADFVSRDSDGFTLNWTTANANTHTVYALGLKGGSYKVGAITQKTSTGSQATTGVGFTPTGQIVFTIGQTAGAALGNIQDVMSGAASDATHRGATQYSAGILSTSLLDRTHVYRHVADDGTPTIQGSADLTSFDTDGWTWNYDVADATAREIVYLAFGNTPAAAATDTGLRSRVKNRPAPFKPMGDAFQPAKYGGWR